jgi:hypothetical protein
MANPANITRRAAIVGALVAPAAAALPAAGVEHVTLEDLAREFKARAMAIDPSITGAWFGMDHMVPGEQSALMSVYFERKHAPFARPAKSAS